MKAISIQNPFAHWIMTGEKTIEVRSWNTEHRGDLLICSSAAPKIPAMISGHALCIVSLDKVTQFRKTHLEAACMDEMPESGSFAWHLSNVRIVKPFPVKGKLNFYYVDDELIEVIDDGNLSPEEADDVFMKYIAPVSYKYGKIGCYYLEKVSGDLIRWRVGQASLEYMSRGTPEWKLTDPTSEYEKAFYDGEGNCELEQITDKKAHKILDDWGVESPYGEDDEIKL